MMMMMMMILCLQYIITTFAGTGAYGTTGDGGVATSAQLKNPYGVSVDISGNVYIADTGNNKIRIVTRTGIITTIAGTGAFGRSGDGGAAISAQLGYPQGVAVDLSGNVYIVDTWNYKIRKVTSTGAITTIAGTGTIGSSGDGGAATSAQLLYPCGVSVDISGNVYIVDASNNKIRMVTSKGIITTFAGTGTRGSSGDGGAATSAQLYNPFGVSVDISGNVYITDTDNHKIRMVTSTGIITTFAGMGDRGSSGDGGDGGPATSATLSYPYGISVDISGNVYIADYGNHKIRMVTSKGIITTFAGTGTAGSSSDGGAATSAQLNYPRGVSVGISRNVYIADTDNHKIRMVTSAGIITTFAGTGTPGDSGDGGAATSAQLYYPSGVSVDISGNVYIADSSNHKIRMVTSTGSITTIAGTGTSGNSGDGGAATSAQFIDPVGVSVDISGNVYIADLYNQKIRMVVPQGHVVSLPTGQPTSQPSRQPTVQPSQQPSALQSYKPTRPPAQVDCRLSLLILSL